jgi:uncharacterized protein
MIDLLLGGVYLHDDDHARNVLENRLNFEVFSIEVVSIMKLKREEITKIAGLIQRHLKDAGLVTSKSTDDRIRERIETVIAKNLEEEAAIEEEVKKLMEQYRSQIASGAIDPQKAYTMIKKQVAKERKFIL